VLLKLTSAVTKFFCQKIGKKVTRYLVCMIPIMALKGEYLEDDDYGIYDNYDHSVACETSFKKAEKKDRELKKSFRSERYKTMILEVRLIKRK